MGAWAALSVFAFFFLKSFINTVIYDFRDVGGDAVAGLRTFPVRLGERRTAALLLAVHLLLHAWLGLSVFVGFLSFQPIILACSWLLGLVYIYLYARTSSGKEGGPRSKMRDFLVDGEFVLAVAFRNLFHLV
ncbi:MAG: 1,4-dihydroxy-2-naphthoate octaprenyltransferase [Methanonatronarchaeales archaeon]|nr:1,4-dihydroxy-2-naphthoate octaprenyltransferase [Methanonatronarchaeales archaeon]